MENHVCSFASSLKHVCNKDGHLDRKQRETILGLMTKRLLVNCHIKQTGSNWQRFQLGAKWTQSGCCP